jgi:hypothetical protein
MKTFEQTWQQKEADGFRYGDDALEQVRLGWDLRENNVQELLRELRECKRWLEAIPRHFRPGMEIHDFGCTRLEGVQKLLDEYSR